MTVRGLLQQLFLEVLFGDEARGDVVKAKVLAGYSPSYSTTALVASLEEEIIDATRKFLSRAAPKAAMAIESGLDDPVQLGFGNRMAAAKDLLDRAGIMKTERVDVSGGVFILPPKEEG